MMPPKIGLTVAPVSSAPTPADHAVVMLAARERERVVQISASMSAMHTWTKKHSCPG